MKITNCTVNHLTNPLGFQMDTPRLSWQVEDTKEKRQVYARIRVSADPDMRGLLWDQERSDADSLGVPLPLSLKPRTRYYWTVEIHGEQGEQAVSDVHWFETAKQDEPWLAKWITCQSRERHPVFSREIPVSGELKSARLYLCGLGLYLAEINGEKVGDEWLTPYCNNYRDWLQYQTYDVTDALRQGGRLSVTLGKGWYSGRMGYMSRPGDEGHYGKEFKLLGEVHLLYADGREEVIGTDESWTVTRSVWLDSSIYDGETRDDTLPETEPEPALLTREEAPLVARYSLPVRVQEAVRPKALLHTPTGELVLDLGQNLVGTFALHVKAERGTKIFVQVGEVLQSGCFYNENLRTAKAEYTYISDGTEKTVAPTFTFYGCRYVKIEGLPNLRAEDFTALVLHSQLPQVGKLVTGNKKVNQLIHNVEWGQKGNFLDVPTDCPQRDERMGWTGDTQVFSPTACYLRQCYPFYRKYLHDMATEQAHLGGMVPNVVPSFGKEYQDTACVWGDAATIIPWNLYQMYGDKTILEEQFDSMTAWVDYITGLDGSDHGWSRHFHFGDWLALDHPDNRPDQCLGGTDVGYIAQVYYRNSAKILADTAAVLGKTEKAGQYAALAKKLTDYIRDEYFTPNGRCCVDTQTGMVLALRDGLSPHPEKCARRLSEKLAQSKGKLQTGFVGTPFLCSELTKNGMERKAYDLLLNEEYPGWLYEVNLGATTVWERWNSMNPDGSVSSTGMNSFNHYAYGSIAQWLVEYAAGLQPAAPGFRKAKIAPVPDVRLGKLDYTYTSAAGTYRIFWETQDKFTLHLKVEIPFGCEAELTLPQSGEEVRHLTAGIYTYTYRTTTPMGKVFSVDMSLAELLTDTDGLKLLNQIMPGIAMIPDSMRQQTLRHALKTLASVPDARIEQIDRLLRS